MIDTDYDNHKQEPILCNSNPLPIEYRIDNQGLENIRTIRQELQSALSGTSSELVNRIARAVVDAEQITGKTEPNDIIRVSYCTISGTGELPVHQRPLQTTLIRDGQNIGSYTPRG